MGRDRRKRRKKGEGKKKRRKGKKGERRKTKRGAGGICGVDEKPSARQTRRIGKLDDD